MSGIKSKSYILQITNHRLQITPKDEKLQLNKSNEKSGNFCSFKYTKVNKRFNIFSKKGSEIMVMGDE
jgi:hypothetical protein